METKHTPGPWEEKPNAEYPQKKIDIVTTEWPHYDIAEVIGGMDGFRVNARLIAAAPDMLEALENIENDDGQMPVSAWNLIQAAIDKATKGIA